jgi:hypothetical protein
MSDRFFYGWQLANGERHHSPVPASQAFVEAHLRAMKQRSGDRVEWFAIPEAELDAWIGQAAVVDAAIEAEDIMLGGNGVPVLARHVQPRIRLEDQTVRILVAKAKAIQAAMRSFRENAFSDVRAFMATVLADYGVTREGRRGGLLLTSFDQLAKIEVSVADQFVFGSEIEAAKALIDECILDWAKGANPYLRTAVMDAFRVGENGRISVDRVMGLRRLQIDDPRWMEAMTAIADAVRTSSIRTGWADC